LLVGTWFAVFVLAKATYVPASVEDASFWRILMPAFPAFLLLAAAVVLLVPGVRARPAPESLTFPARRLTVALAVAVLAFALLPLGVIAAIPPLKDGGRQAVIFDDNLLPVASHVRLQATRDGSAVRLSWKAPVPRSSSVFYRLLRTKGATDAFCAGTRAADQCRLYADSPASVRATSYVDHPGPGTWSYRIGVSANWRNDERLGDVYLISPAQTVTIP
jgi:hypothetical protein